MEKNTIFIIIFISLTFKIMAQDYSVMDVSQLNIIEDNNKALKEYQLQFNGAVVILLEDGRVLLLPNVGGEGICFKNFDAFEKMKQDGYFPVKGVGDIYEDERERLKNPDSNIQYYLDKLKNKLQLDSISPSDVQEVNKALKKLSKHELENEFYIPIGIYLGEILRTKLNGKWASAKQYTMNPYYIPLVQDSLLNCYSFWTAMYKGMRNMKTFNLEKIADKIIKEHQPYDNFQLNKDHLFSGE